MVFVELKMLLAKFPIVIRRKIVNITIFVIAFRFVVPVCAKPPPIGVIVAIAVALSVHLLRKNYNTLKEYYRTLQNVEGFGRNIFYLAVALSSPFSVGFIASIVSIASIASVVPIAV